MARFLRDRYFWFIITILVISIILIWVAEAYIQIWASPQSEWALAYMSFHHLILLLLVAIAAWRFGVKGGMIACLAVGLIVLPYVIAKWQQGLLIEYLLMGAIAVSLSWLIGNYEKKKRLLEKSRDQLEVRVRERTTQLAEANEQLGEELAERKKAEEKLRQSEGKYRSLVSNVKLGIFRSTPGATGRFLETNPAMGEITGYSREELLQMNVSDLYVHPEERKTVLEEIASIEGKTTKELYFKKKDGTTISVSDTKVAVRDNEGRILFFDGILEDITKRKRVEEELRGSRKQLRNLSAHLQSAREEERKYIAREVHDEMGQQLTALKIDLSWLAKKFSKGQESLLDKTESMLTLVDETMKTVKQISGELRPALLDDFGLLAAVEWHLEEFQELTGIECEVALNPDSISLDEERSIAIFRILQEALTNVARHAEATKVKVSLQLEDNKLTLRISDNGSGTTEKEILSPRSFGLIGMRERIRVLKGKISITSIEDKGTTVMVSIPLKMEKLNAKNTYR